MSEYIQLPRSALTEEMERNGDLARLLVYLLRKTDENGEIKTDMAKVAADLSLSRQSVRTLMKKFESNQILTKSSTTRATKLKLDYQEGKRKRQPNKQPNRQPNVNQIKECALGYISPSFVAAEYREIWQKFIIYRKEIKKPYKSPASEQIAYNKMVEMAGNDPAVAKDMVERTILGQWQGLFPKNNNGTKTTTTTDNATTRAQSRDRLRSLATGVVSQSADKLLNLYNGVGQNSDDSAH